MRSARAAVILAAGPFLAGAAVSLAASDVVVGSNQKRTYDCRGGTATVEGGDNVVTFRNCVTVIVEGGDNTIDAGLAEVIEVPGADNRVTWTESADGRRPRIVNAGEGNVITSKKGAAGTSRSSAPPARRSAPEDRITITGEGVKVQGDGGTVTVGGAGGGTVTIRQDPPAAAGKIRIDHDGRKADHDCRGGSAVINGDRNELSLRNCDQVTVNGDANRVSVRAVATVLLNGGDNTLAWEEAADGSRPKITDNGRGNTVSGKR